MAKVSRQYRKKTKAVKVAKGYLKLGYNIAHIRLIKLSHDRGILYFVESHRMPERNEKIIYDEYGKIIYRKKRSSMLQPSCSEIVWRLNGEEIRTGTDSFPTGVLRTMVDILEDNPDAELEITKWEGGDGDYIERAFEAAKRIAGRRIPSNIINEIDEQVWYGRSYSSLLSQYDSGPKRVDLRGKELRGGKKYTTVRKHPRKTKRRQTTVKKHLRKLKKGKKIYDIYELEGRKYYIQPKIAIKFWKIRSKPAQYTLEGLGRQLTDYEIAKKLGITLNQANAIEFGEFKGRIKR